MPSNAAKQENLRKGNLENIYFFKMHIGDTKSFNVWR